MATVYPDGVDDWQDPVGSDALSTSPDGRTHSEHHDDLTDVVLSMETQLVGPVFTSSAAYSDIPAVVIHSADATSDSLGTWNAAGTHNSDTPSVDNSIFTEGTGSVTCDLNLPSGSGTTQKLYVDLTTPLAVGGHGAVTVACRFKVGSGSGSQQGFRVVVADAAGLAGNIASSRITQDSDSSEAWFTITIPVGTLTSIASVGIGKDPSASGSSSKWVTWWLDDLSLRENTAIDSALADVDGAVVVPSDYVPTESQFPDSYNSPRSVLDLRVAHANLPGIGGVYNLRDWRLDETGTEDVTEDLQRIVDSLDDGTTLVAPPNAIYRIDDTVTIGDGKYQFTFDGQGSRWVQPTEVNSSLFALHGVETTFRGVRGYSLNSQTSTDLTNWVSGDTTHPIVGTPTLSGTSVVLDTVAEQVELPWRDDDEVAYYARDHLGVNSWDFVLADTNHVANDCKFTVMSPDGTVLQTTTQTLTGTPTTYTVSFTPDNLYVPLRVAVSKATATTNTITLSSATMYGRQRYIADLAFNHLVKAQGEARNAVVMDCWAEGMGGDAVTTGSAIGLLVERVVGRVTGRQGMSYNDGQYVTVRNCEVIGAGRHSIDLEPETQNVEIVDVVFENCRFIDPGIGHISATAWPRVRRVHMRNCDFLSTSKRGGAWMAGGWWDGTLENCSFIRLGQDTSSAFQFSGRAVSISNITATPGLSLEVSTGKKGVDGLFHTADYINVNGWNALNPTADVFVSAIDHYNAANVNSLGGSYSLEYDN